MRQNLLILVLTILTGGCVAQITFEKGYFIDNEGQKVNCLIKNFDWKNNPTQIEYRINNQSEKKIISCNSIKEFGVDQISKYVSASVDIDRSSSISGDLSEIREPIFQKETLFLKVLIDGNASLYEYINNNLKRYFYSVNKSTIEQLIFKKYKVQKDNIIENNGFRKQLWDHLKCIGIEVEDVRKLKYRKDDLVDFFSRYNDCQNSEFINFIGKQKREIFNLSVRPRVTSTFLSIKNDFSNFSYNDSDRSVKYAFGLEAEFILPYNRNKWSLLFEPTLRNFETDKITNVDFVSGGQLMTIIKYNSIEIPVGLRYYLFLNDNSKFFINAAVVFDRTYDSIVEFKRGDGSKLISLLVQPRANYALGFGFKQNDKFSVELRYLTDREILGGYLLWNSNYKQLSMILGYTLF